MATSITQAKPLLTAAELELFDQSRAEPIKAFTAKQLASKETRARTLRDKYRDLYRRQTVAQRGKTGAAKGRAAALTPAAGEANTRTQRKSEIMQEMLQRFEARSAVLGSRSQREADQKPAQVAGKPGAKFAQKMSPTAAKKSAPTAATKGSKTAPAKKAASGTQVTKSTKTAQSATTAGKTITPPAVKKSTTPAKKARPTKAHAAPAANTAASAKGSETGPTAKAASSSSIAGAKGAAATRKPKQTEAPLSALNHLNDGAASAVHVEHLTGLDPTQRSHKAPSVMAPTYGDKAHAPDVNAPLDMLPSAQRSNPVRSMPGNIAIQGHVSSSIRRAQGKKDSR